MTVARTFELARIAVRLRWRLIHNQATRSGRPRRRWLATLAAVVYCGATIAALVTARLIDDEGAEQTVVVLVSSLALGWIFGPILSGGVDETVDPTRLALLPLRPRETFTVQVASALSGNGALAALVGLGVGVPIAFASAAPTSVLVVLAGPLTVLVVLGLGRVAAASLAIAQRSRTGRDLAVLAASLVAGALFVAAQLGGRFTDARGARVVAWLGWAPWSWPARAAVAARAGEPWTALGWITASVILCVGVLALWSRLSSILLVRGERVVRSGRRGRGATLLGARSAFGAALARQWVYLRRSPNTRVSFVFGIAFGVAFSVVQIVQRDGADHPLAPFGILLAMVGNLGASSNLLGFDAGSLWLEVLTGGPGRRQVAARSLMALPNLLVPTWVSGLVVGVWTGQWAGVGLVSLIAVPVALMVLAVGVVTSLVAPWPVPDGDNPFANRQAAHGRQARLATVALAGIAGSGALAAPVVVAAYVARDEPWALVVPALAMVLALLIGTVALRWAGRRLAGAEPELLELLSPLAVN